MSQFNPSLLVAMPGLDGYFKHSIILLCDYTQESASGFVINAPTPFFIQDILKSNVDFQIEAPLLLGGPVQSDFFWSLHSNDFCDENTTLLTPQLSLSPFQIVIDAIIRNQGPKDYHFGCGYSGWGENQLDDEIRQGAWWLTDIDYDLIFKGKHQQRWHHLIQALGIDPDISYMDQDFNA